MRNFQTLLPSFGFSETPQTHLSSRANTGNSLLADRQNVEFSFGLYLQDFANLGVSQMTRRLPILLLLIYSVCYSMNLNGQCVTNVDFNNWSQAGVLANGNWVVQAGGASVRQTINGNPTYFINDDDLINVRISGNFKSTDDDDDWMGFVVGFQEPMGQTTNYDQWLFDWKKGNQNGGCGPMPSGKSFNRVNGNISGAAVCAAFNTHVQSPEFQVLANDFGGPGWCRNCDHSFSVEYTYTRTKIWVDGNLAFDVPGCYEPGRFGFYNLSQKNCSYWGFQYELAIDFRVLTPEVCVNQDVAVQFIDPCVVSPLLSQIAEITWDFGDGTVNTVTNPTLADVNATHQYTSPGTKTITFTLTDDQGCTDQASHTVIVNPGPQAAFNVDQLCFGDTAAFSDASTGSTPVTWNWTFGDGSTAQGSSVEHSYNAAGSYQVQLELEDAGGCQTSATETVIITQLPDLTTVPTVIDDVSCYGGTDGSIDITVSYGQPPYVFDWNNGAFATEDLLNISEGTYAVLVTDDNGCSTSGSYAVAQPSAPVSTSLTPQLHPNGYHILCNGDQSGAIDLLVSGGTGAYTYNWNSGLSLNEDLANISAGNFSVVVTDQQGCVARDSVELLEPTAMSYTIQADTFPGGANISCFGRSDGQVDLTINGGVAPYTVYWNNGLFITEDLMSVTAGQYEFLVEDQSNCQLRDSVRLTEPDSIGVSGTTSVFAGGFEVTCYGAQTGSINTQVTGGTPPFQYSWNGGTFDTPDLAGLPAGTYNLALTDVNGCAASYSDVLNDPQPLSEIVQTAEFNGYNVSCFGGTNGSISLTVSGGVSPYTYDWNTGLFNTAQIVGLTASNYDYLVTDANGCTLSNSLSLTEPVELNTSVSSPLNVGGYHISCQGASDGSVDLMVSGGTTPYQFDWNSGTAITQNLTGVSAGNYSVEITDANGCAIQDQINLTEPSGLGATTQLSQFAGNYNISCNQATDGAIDVTLNGGTPPYSYTWNTGANTEDLTNLSAGSYEVTISDANGCSSVLTEQLIQPDALNSNLGTPLIAGGYSIDCYGENSGSINTQITGGTQPYSFNWNNGQFSTSTLDNLSAGQYVLDLTDANGCVISDQITLTQPDALSADLSAYVYSDGYNTTCFGSEDGSIDLSISGGVAPYQANWSDGFTGTNSNFDLAVGDYSVIVTDMNGCTVSDYESIIEPDQLIAEVMPPHLDLSLGEAIEVEVLTNLNSSAEFVWTPIQGLNCYDCPNPVVYSYQSQDYLVQVTKILDDVGAVGCSTKAVLTVNVENSSPIFVPNVFTPNRDGINDKFQIFADNIGTFNMQIYARSGELVYETDSQSDAWDGTYKGTPVSPGVYAYYVKGRWMNGQPFQTLKGTVSVVK